MAIDESLLIPVALVVGPSGVRERREFAVFDRKTLELIIRAERFEKLRSPALVGADHHLRALVGSDDAFANHFCEN